MPLMTSAEFAAKDGGCCPKCQEDTHLEYYGLDFESGAIYQEARCLECGFEWSDSYQISGYVSSEDPPEEPPEPQLYAVYFEGHWPVGAVAVIKALSAEEAAEKLAVAIIEEEKLEGDRDIRARPIPLGGDEVDILLNGEY